MAASHCYESRTIGTQSVTEGEHFAVRHSRTTFASPYPASILPLALCGGNRATLTGIVFGTRRDDQRNGVIEHISDHLPVGRDIARLLLIGKPAEQFRPA